MHWLLKSAGRLTKTHSKGRPLSLLEIRQEAYGVMGLHPWEFRKYTFKQYILKRRGFFDNRDIMLRADFQHFRLVAYFCVYPHLTKAGRQKPYSDIIPDIYEKNTKKEDFAKWFEEKSKQAKERTKKLKNLKNIGKRA